MSILVRDRQFYKTLVLLALPIALQNLITFGVSFADNLMVGQLGEAAIAGLYMGTLVHTVLQIVLFGVSSTILVLSTQYWGRKDCGHIKDVVAIGMRVALLGTLAISLVSFFFPVQIIRALTPEPGAIAAGAAYLRIVSVSYLFFTVSELLLVAMRSVEIVRIGLVNSLVAFAVNATLNYIFIFGKLGLPAMGVAGAAWGTVAARLVELAVVGYYVFFLDQRLRLRSRDFGRWNPLLFRDLVRYGTPLLLGQVVWAINNFGQTAIIGQMTGAEIAAASITGTFHRLLWMGTFGLTTAIGIITGKTIGMGEFGKMREYARTMQVIFLGIGLCSGLAILLGHERFISLYRLAPESIPVVKAFMYVLVFAIIGQAYQCPCLMGLVKAGGDTAFVFKNDTFWVFCWVLPAAFVAQRFFQAPGWAVYALLLSDQVTKCFVAVIKVNRFDWMRRLTREKGA